MWLAKVVKRSVESNGKLIGSHNELVYLNTVLLYDIEFPDGSVKPYFVNSVA